MRGSTEAWYGRRYWFQVVPGARSLNALRSPLRSPLTYALNGGPVCSVYTKPHSQLAIRRLESPRRFTASIDVSYMVDMETSCCRSASPGARVSSVLPCIDNEPRSLRPPNTVAIGCCGVSEDRENV